MKIIDALFSRKAKDEKPEAKKAGSHSLIDYFNKRNAGMWSKFLTEQTFDRAAALKRIMPRNVLALQTCSVANGTVANHSAAWTFDEEGADDTLLELKKCVTTCDDIPDDILQFYSRGFIGWNTCALLAQHEFINRACAIPGEDAIAVGYSIKPTIGDDADGDGKKTKADEKFLTSLKKRSDRSGIDQVCARLDYNKRVFGIAVAVPTFDDTTIDMSVPLNFDNGKLKSYTGFKVIDPYWISPKFDVESSQNPASKYFFEPTWWQLPNGKLIHRSWCVTVRMTEVSDTYKPSYIYGGVPLTQMIYERVFAADKCANEAPMLAMSKRLLIVDANIQQVIADHKHVKQLMDVVTFCRNNWGVMFKNPTAAIDQIDTSLGEFDQLIMTQYQLVASIAQMPATKLLKVTPTGFQSTGEYEWKDWAQSLIDVQNNEFVPLLERHFKFLAKRYGNTVMDFDVEFNEVDAPSRKEIAEINHTRATVYSELLGVGVVTVDEVRDAIRAEDNSFFKTLSSESPKKTEEEIAKLAEKMKGGEGGTGDEAEDVFALDEDDLCEAFGIDKAEWKEYLHKRGADGRFVRTAGEGVSSYRVGYVRKRGKKGYRDKDGNFHLYGTTGIVEQKPFSKFPPLKPEPDAKKVSKALADRYNGGSTERDLTKWDEFAAKYKADPDPNFPDNPRKTEVFVRSERMRSDVKVTKIGEGKKAKTVYSQKSGKPYFDWTLAGQKLSDKEAFDLEHALANSPAGCCAAAVSVTSAHVRVKTAFASSEGNVADYWLRGSNADKPSRKFCKDPETSRMLKNEHNSYLDELVDHGDKILDVIEHDATHPEKLSDEGEYWGTMAYLQYRTSFRVGSSADNQGDGMLDLTRNNVKLLKGDKIRFTADTKNAEWHVDIEDKYLHTFFEHEFDLMEDEPKDAKIFNTTYREYLGYIKNVGVRAGMDYALGTHGMRHLAASRYAYDLMDSIEPPKKGDAKSESAYIRKAADAITKVGVLLNDESTTVFKSYVSSRALWHKAPWLLKKNRNLAPQG